MNTKRGIVGTIVLVIVALILLGYFNINVQQVVSTPTVQNNLLYAWQLLIAAIERVGHFLGSTIHDLLLHRNQ